MMNTNDKIKDIELEIISSKVQVESVIVNVLERGDKLEDLEDKAIVLADSADMFRKQAKQIKKRMCCEKYKNYLLIGIPILCIIVFIIALLYYEFK